jgi:flagellar motor protein MotB
LLWLLALPLAAPAQAQAPPRKGLDVNTFNVAVDEHTYLSVHGAQVPRHLDYGVGLIFHYQRHPFTVTALDAGGLPTDDRTHVVRDLLIGELYGFVGLWKHVALGLSLPLGLYASGTVVDDVGTAAPGGGYAAFTWGDLGIHLKGKIWGRPGQGLQVGAQLTITTPIGQFADRYAGEASATFRPRVILEWLHPRVRAAVNLGGVLRAETVTFFDGAFRLGQQASYGLAVAVTPAQKVPLQLLAELSGRTDFTNHLDRNPMELGLAVDWALPRGVHLVVGAGAGLLAGIGTPDFRVLLGVRWMPRIRDRDGDGIPDEKDRCPDQAEDKDGFEDADGCPDPDNDKDGIPDTEDKCPNEPEDMDQFEDSDGCPDPDNDKDGIPDKQDNCPLAAGPRETKGCPREMLDEDGDEIPDHLDKCPNEPEDKDGFQDDDGCPDPDNDGDGILDKDDRCPNEPEDKDGFQDDDGCPDPDNDGDGVCDDNPVIQKHLDRFRDRCTGRDLCPDKPETINGVKDDDGCPDPGVGDVVWRKGATAGDLGLLVLPPRKVAFKGDSTTLLPGAEPVLEQLAHVLRTLPVTTRLTITAYTDLTQPPAEALRLTEAWAKVIVALLVKQGIAPQRLAAVGAGITRPVCQTTKPACNAQNRRLELRLSSVSP